MPEELTLRDLMNKFCILGPQKVCPTCKESWPEDDEFFYRDPRGKNGLKSQCRACVSEIANAANKRRKAA